MSTRKAAAIGIALALAGSGSAFACNTGDVYCDNRGYRWECQCYTTEGCQYYHYGVCSAYYDEGLKTPRGAAGAGVKACFGATKSC